MRSATTPDYQTSLLPYLSLRDHAPVLSGEIQSLALQIPNQPQFRNTSRPQDPPTPALSALAETMIDQTVSEILADAGEWAAKGGLPSITIDHLLFSMSRRELGAHALTEAGLQNVRGLEEKLLNLVYFAPGARLADNLAPAVDNSILALVHHAQAHARAAGRDICNAEDLLRALRYAIVSGDLNSAGVSLLREHWPQISTADPALAALAELRSVQSQQLTGGVRQLQEQLAGMESRLTSFVHAHYTALEELSRQTEARLACLEVVQTTKVERTKPVRPILLIVGSVVAVFVLTTASVLSFVHL